MTHLPLSHSRSESYEGPGRYRHYKGGEYEVVGLAIREATLDKSNVRPGEKLVGDIDVIYRPMSPGSLLSGSEIRFWSRPLDDFNAMVEREHGPAPRFTPLLLSRESEREA